MTKFGMALQGGSNLARAADLRSGEICFTVCSHLVIRVFDRGDNYRNRGGLAKP